MRIRLLALIGVIFLLASVSVFADEYLEKSIPLFECQNLQSGDVFYSTSESCPVSGLNGVSGRIALVGYILKPTLSGPDLPVGSVPLYSCRDSTDYYLSTSATCNGHTIVSHIGYLLPPGGSYTLDVSIEQCQTAAGDRIVVDQDHVGRCTGPRAVLGLAHRSQPISCNFGQFLLFDGHLDTSGQTCNVDSGQTVIVYNNLHDSLRYAEYYAGTFNVNTPITFRHVSTGDSTAADGGIGNTGDRGERGGTGGKGGAAHSYRGARGGPNENGHDAVGGLGGASVLLSAQTLTYTEDIIASGEDGGFRPGETHYTNFAAGGGGGGAGGQVVLAAGTINPTAGKSIDVRGGNGGRGQHVQDRYGEHESGPGGGGGGGEGGTVYTLSHSTVTVGVVSPLVTGGTGGAGGVSGAERNSRGQAGNAGSGGTATVQTYGGFAENNPYLCQDGIDNDHDGLTDGADGDCNALCAAAGGVSHLILGCCGDLYDDTSAATQVAGDCGQNGIENQGLASQKDWICYATGNPFAPPVWQDPDSAPSNLNWQVVSSRGDAGGPGQPGGHGTGHILPLGCANQVVLSSGLGWKGHFAGDGTRLSKGGNDYLFVDFTRDNIPSIAECAPQGALINTNDELKGVYARETGGSVGRHVNNPSFFLLDGSDPAFWNLAGDMEHSSSEGRTDTSSLKSTGSGSASQSFSLKPSVAGHLSASVWVKFDDIAGSATLQLSAGQTCSVSADNLLVGVWQQIGCGVPTPSNSVSLTLSTGGSVDIFFDDVEVGTAYCLSDQTFDEDLDDDEDACTGAGLGWTGSYCCSEQEDYLSDGSREYYNDPVNDLGACFAGAHVPEGTVPVYPDGKLKANSVPTHHREVVNIGGTLRGCALDEFNGKQSWANEGSNLQQTFYGTPLEQLKQRKPLGGSYVDNLDNDALLNLVDCPNPGSQSCSQNQLIEDNGYCAVLQTQGNPGQPTHYYCSFEEIWKPGGVEEEDTLKLFDWNKQEYDQWIADGKVLPQYLDAGVPIAYENLSPAECCGANSCWDGRECAPSEHDNPDPDTRREYPGSRYCVSGEWKNQEEKLPWNNDLYFEGFCEREDQCLVSIDGDYANNDNPSSWDPANPSLGPQCITAGQHIQDHYCEPIVDPQTQTVIGARWSTRTKQLAGTFIDYLRDNSINDYTLYCDEYDRTLNKVDYPAYTDPQSSLFVMGAQAEDVFIKGDRSKYLNPAGLPSQLCPGDECVNNFCVLRWEDNGEEKTALGVSLNIPHNTSGHGFLAALGESDTACDNVFGPFGGNLDEFQECNSQQGNDKLWLNSEANSVVFSLHGIDLTPSRTAIDTILSFLGSYIPPLQQWVANVEEHSAPGLPPTNYPYAGNVQSFSKFYESSVSDPANPQVVEKRVQAVKEEHVIFPGIFPGPNFLRDYIAVRFTNFDGDFCKTVNAIESQAAAHARYACTKFGNDYELVAERGLFSSAVYDLWGEMTARLRIQPATPPCEPDLEANGYYNPLCPGNDPDYIADDFDGVCRLKEINERSEPVYLKNGEYFFDGTSVVQWVDADCDVCHSDIECDDGNVSTIDTCEEDTQANDRVIPLGKPRICVNTPIPYCSGNIPDTVCPFGCNLNEGSTFDIDCELTSSFIRQGSCISGETEVAVISDPDSGHLITSARPETYSVCVDSDKISTRSDDDPCSGSMLFYAQDGHARDPTFQDQELDVDIEYNTAYCAESASPISCEVKSGCDEGELCILQLSDQDNAHVSSCESQIQQPWKVCCSIG